MVQNCYLNCTELRCHFLYWSLAEIDFLLQQVCEKVAQTLSGIFPCVSLQLRSGFLALLIPSIWFVPTLYCIWSYRTNLNNILQRKDPMKIADTSPDWIFLTPLSWIPSQSAPTAFFIMETFRAIYFIFLQKIVYQILQTDTLNNTAKVLSKEVVPTIISSSVFGSR